jgi:small subunit ribosomal protein S16
VSVKIKLKRLGKIRAPYYRIVVADARTKRDGRAIEEIGKYHPKAEPSFIEVDSERAQHWLSVGAQPTDPVRKILEITGDWQKFKGLPGAEGTLKTAAPKEDRKDIFAAAVKETLGDAAPAPKGRSRSAKDSDAAAEKAAKPAAKDAPAKAEKPAKVKADQPAKAKAGGEEAKADQPAKAKAGGEEAKADQPAKAKAGGEEAKAAGDGRAKDKAKGAKEAAAEADAAAKAAKKAEADPAAVAADPDSSSGD